MQVWSTQLMPHYRWNLPLFIMFSLINPLVFFFWLGKTFFVMVSSSLFFCTNCRSHLAFSRVTLFDSREEETKKWKSSEINCKIHILDAKLLNNREHWTCWGEIIILNCEVLAIAQTSKAENERRWKPFICFELKIMQFIFFFSAT